MILLLRLILRCGRAALAIYMSLINCMLGSKNLLMHLFCMILRNFPGVLLYF